MNRKDGSAGGRAAPRRLLCRRRAALPLSTAVLLQGWFLASQPPPLVVPPDVLTATSSRLPCFLSPPSATGLPGGGSAATPTLHSAPNSFPGYAPRRTLHQPRPQAPLRSGLWQPGPGILAGAALHPSVGLGNPSERLTPHSPVCARCAFLLVGLRP